MRRFLLLTLIATGLFGCQPTPNVDSTAPSNTQFVFIKIFEQIGPVERGTKYEDPLDVVLKKERVGRVSGGGTQLTAPALDGKATIEWIGLDVDLTDFDNGMRILKRELLSLGAPVTTVFEYTRSGKEVTEKLQ